MRLLVLPLFPIFRLSLNTRLSCSSQPSYTRVLYIYFDRERNSYNPLSKHTNISFPSLSQCNHRMQKNSSPNKVQSYPSIVALSKPPNVTTLDNHATTRPTSKPRIPNLNSFIFSPSFRSTPSRVLASMATSTLSRCGTCVRSTLRWRNATIRSISSSRVSVSAAVEV